MHLNCTIRYHWNSHLPEAHFQKEIDRDVGVDKKLSSLFYVAYVYFS